MQLSAQQLLQPPETFAGSCSTEHCHAVTTIQNTITKQQIIIYLGSSTTARDLQFLQQSQIGHIVNVANDVKKIDYSELFCTLHIPLHDSTKFTITKEHVQQMLHFVQTQVQNDTQSRNLLLHCSAGVSRSATMMVLLVMYLKQQTLMEAWNMVKQARKYVYPNKQFALQLVQAEWDLFGKNTISKDEVLLYHEDQS